MGARAARMGLAVLENDPPAPPRCGRPSQEVVQRVLIVGSHKIGHTPETLDEIVEQTYLEVLAAVSQPVSGREADFFRRLRLMDEWKKRPDEMKAVLKEWISAPDISPKAPRARGSPHALIRQYDTPLDVGVAILGRADSAPKIAAEERQADEVLQSDVLKLELAEFVGTKLKEFLEHTTPDGLDANLMSLIEGSKGRYLPHMGAGELTIDQILESPDEYSIGLLTAAIHDVTDILWTNEDAKPIVTIPDQRKQATIASVRDDRLLFERAVYQDSDWRGKSATPKEASAPIETARVLATPVSMGPSNTTGRMMMLAEASGADVQTRESIAWGLFAFWYREYRRELTDIHRQHFVMDMAANFGVPYDPGQPIVPTRYSVLERAKQHALLGGRFATLPPSDQLELTDAAVKLLTAGRTLSEIEKESVRALEARTTKILLGIAMRDGWSQDELTGALVQWYRWVE